VLCEPEAPAFGAALRDLLTDRARAARVGAAGRARAQAEYTPEAFRRKVLAFYGAVEQKLEEQLRVR